MSNIKIALMMRDGMALCYACGTLDDIEKAASKMQYTFLLAEGAHSTVSAAMTQAKMLPKLNGRPAIVQAVHLAAGILY